MVSKSTKFVSHLGWISANYYDEINDEFLKLLMKFIKYECLCNKDIRRNFTFVNIGVVPLLARVKWFFLVHVH